MRTIDRGGKQGKGLIVDDFSNNEYLTTIEGAIEGIRSSICVHHYAMPMTSDVGSERNAGHR